MNQFSKHLFHSELGSSKTCNLNASTASSGVKNRSPRSLFLIVGNKKQSLKAKSGLYGDPLIQLFDQSKMPLLEPPWWELALSWWRMIRLLFDFLGFLQKLVANKWLCTYHSEFTVFRSSNATIATWPAMWLCALFTNHIGGIRFILKLKDPHSGLLFGFGIICIYPQFITCTDVIYSLWSTSCKFVQHCPTPIESSLLLSN